MERAIKTDNGRYQLTVKGQTYTINKGGNMNPGWWIWDVNKKCMGRGISKFSCEVFLNYGNPAHLESRCKHYRY